MEHKGTVAIKTERLLLRPFSESDVDAAFENWMSSAEVTKYLRWKRHENKEMTAKVISEWVSKYKFKDFYHWAIVLCDICEPIGSISVVNTDEKTDTLEAGYCEGVNFWRKGYMPEALKAVSGFLFDEVGARRIRGVHDLRNPASGAVLRKCGFRFERILRGGAVNNEGLADMAEYYISAEEFGAGK